MNNLTRRFLLSGLSAAALMVSGAATAQKPVMASEAVRLPGLQKLPLQGCESCSNPFKFEVLKSSGPTNPDPSDFLPAHLVNPAGYNGTQPNKLFAETIRWTVPAIRPCEMEGTVSYTVKNVLNDGLQGNDLTVLMIAGGTQVPGTRQPIALPVGQSQTFSYPLTPAQIQSGKVSIFVQDDTSVTQVKVNIRGCCINPNLK